MQFVIPVSCLYLLQGGALQRRGDVAMRSAAWGFRQVLPSVNIYYYFCINISLLRHFVVLRKRRSRTPLLGTPKDMLIKVLEMGV